MSMVLQVLLVAFAIEHREQRAVRSFGKKSLVPTSTFVPCEPIDKDVIAGRLREVDGAMFANVVVVICKLFASPACRWLFAIGTTWHVHNRLEGKYFIRNNANTEHIKIRF
jgi:hypothetical protein